MYAAGIIPIKEKNLFIALSPAFRSAGKATARHHVKKNAKSPV
jgi:hypothetical protein